MSSWTLAVQGFYPSFSAAIDVVLVSGTISDPSQLPLNVYGRKTKRRFQTLKVDRQMPFPPIAYQGPIIDKGCGLLSTYGLLLALQLEHLLHHKLVWS